MPIGDSCSITAKNIASRIFLKFLGTPDLHTHIRLRPMITFFRKYIPGRAVKTMEVFEVGCGNGVNAFELAKIAKKYNMDLRYAGIDMDREVIEKAETAAKLLDKERALKFYCADALSVLEKNEGSDKDAILLIDILEHLNDVKKMADIAYSLLKREGLLVISVPTRIYPKVFGRRFHERIGHMVDGYSLEELDGIFSTYLGCRRVAFSYNTGLLSNIGCWLFYNIFDSANKYLYFLKGLLLYPSIFLDIYNSSVVSCTLFAVYRKE